MVTLDEERTNFKASAHLFVLNYSNFTPEVLLLKRQNVSYGNGLYGVPSGHIESGETALEAAIRETKEETGLDLLPNGIVFNGVMHNNNYIYFFFSTVVSENARKKSIVNMEPDKCESLDWFGLENLPENIVEYLPATIELSIEAEEVWLKKWHSVGYVK